MNAQAPPQANATSTPAGAGELQAAVTAAINGLAAGCGARAGRERPAARDGPLEVARRLLDL